jgi:hypothetical protein
MFFMKLEIIAVSRVARRPAPDLLAGDFVPGHKGHSGWIGQIRQIRSLWSDRPRLIFFFIPVPKMLKSRKSF